MADLLFDRPAPASTALVFGDGLTPALANVVLTGTLPALTVLINLIPPALVELTGVFAGLSLTAEVSYHSNTERPTVATLRAAAQVATQHESGLTQPQQHAVTDSTGAQVFFQEATPTNTGSMAGFATARAATASTGAVFQDAVTTGDTTRAALLPNVPTCDESGLSGYSVRSWQGILAPARTPKPVVDKLGKELAEVLKNPGLIQKLQASGARVMAMVSI